MIVWPQTEGERRAEAERLAAAAKAAAEAAQSETAGLRAAVAQVRSPSPSIQRSRLTVLPDLTAATYRPR